MSSCEIRDGLSTNLKLFRSPAAPRISQELIRATPYNLPRRFDRCAIGAAGKNAILQARACGQFMRQEVADRSEQHYRHERDHRAAAVSVTFVICLIVHSSRPAVSYQQPRARRRNV